MGGWRDLPLRCPPWTLLVMTVLFDGLTLTLVAAASLTSVTPPISATAVMTVLSDGFGIGGVCLLVLVRPQVIDVNKSMMNAVWGGVCACVSIVCYTHLIRSQMATISTMTGCFQVSVGMPVMWSIVWHRVRMSASQICGVILGGIGLFVMVINDEIVEPWAPWDMPGADRWLFVICLLTAGMEDCFLISEVMRVQEIAGMVLGFFIGSKIVMLCVGWGEPTVSLVWTAPWALATFAAGACSMVKIAFFTVCQMRSDLAVVTTLSGLSMLMPALFGLVAQHESMTPMKVVGLLACGVSPILCAWRSKAAKPNAGAHELQKLHSTEA